MQSVQPLLYSLVIDVMHLYLQIGIHHWWWNMPCILWMLTVLFHIEWMNINGHDKLETNLTWKRSLFLYGMSACIWKREWMVYLCALWQSEIASLKADNERLQTVIAEKAGIDGAELLRQTSAHSASAADAAPGWLSTVSRYINIVWVISILFDTLHDCDNALSTGTGTSLVYCTWPNRKLMRIRN